MSNTIKVQNILSQCYKDFTENSSIYNEVYKFYKDKALSIDDINLILMDIELKVSNQTKLIDNFAKISITLSIPAYTYFTNIILKNKVFAHINIYGIIAFVIVAILLYFSCLKPAIREVQNSHQEKLIYLITIKALNDLKNEIQ
ncbi:hypothetical protein [Paraclostridium sordellii]|uniref:hypothetical protein n=1 Tax=Paraclostridium sordellii TaxID=1505 RepID=UPI0005DEDECB|nr:hypothetical protein [Paeniclostridium sordellii]CEN90110.1 Uncharacterised protein [[Clostridium] sordellii] [Paeniclostridium sordellii]